ncbi:hypothetical protein NKH77_12330 [Streptomyces sp. M19]
MTACRTAARISALGVSSLAFTVLTINPAEGYAYEYEPGTAANQVVAAHDHPAPRTTRARG